MRRVTNEECLDKLVQAKEKMKALTNSKEPSKFKQQCEDVFTDFRQAVVHLRRDREALDSVTEKEVTWRFLCRFAQEVPFQHGRCVEVLRYLLISDEWVKAFADDPDVAVDKLPPAIKDEFEDRLKHVDKDPPAQKTTDDKKTDPWSQDPKQGYPQPKAKSKTDPWSPEPRGQPEQPASIGGMPQLCATSMSLVVQRCLKASISSDKGRNKKEIGAGLVVSVSMSDGATEEGVKSAADFVLTAKLSGRSEWFPGEKGLDKFGDGADSVVNLCKAGHHQGIMIVPQPSLVARIQDGETVSRDLAYSRSSVQSRMYNLFVASLQQRAPVLVNSAPSVQGGAARGKVDVEVIAGEFGSNIFTIVDSAGPFMHSFQF